MPTNSGEPCREDGDLGPPVVRTNDTCGALCHIAPRWMPFLPARLLHPRFGPPCSPEESVHPQKRIVVGVDYSPLAGVALVHALEGLDALNVVELHVVHVTRLPFVPVGVEFGWEDRDPGASLAEESERLRQYVEHELAATGARPGLERVTLHVKVGHPAEGIARLAAEVDADMIVLGTHGRRGMRRWILGSVAEATIRIAGCPVLVVRRKAHESAQREQAARQKPSASSGP